MSSCLSVFVHFFKKRLEVLLKLFVFFFQVFLPFQISPEDWCWLVAYIDPLNLADLGFSLRIFDKIFLLLALKLLLKMKAIQVCF